MKKIRKVSLLLLLVGISSAGFSQEQKTPYEKKLTPKLGIKGGINLSNLYVNDVQDENVRVGWNLGLMAKLPVARGFSIQPELSYTTKGSKLTYDNAFGKGEYRFNLDYVELPLLAVFNLTPNFNIHAGPYIAFLTGAGITDLKSDGTIQNIRDLDAENFHRFDYGLAGGMGVDMGNFLIGARYNYGLHDVGKSGSLSGELTRDSKNNNISVYMGVAF